MTDWVDAGADDLQDGRPVSRLVAGRMVLLVRQRDALHATDAICPHKFAMLADGAFGDGCVTCPQHEATFDLRTGECGSDGSWAGRLPVHAVRSDGDRLAVRLSG